MQIKVIKDLRKAIIYLSITEKNFNLVEKASPETLVVNRTENGESIPVFQVSRTTGNGSIASCGAAFGGVADDGRLMITLDIPKTCNTDEKIKDYVADAVLKAQINIEAIEKAVEVKAAEVATAQENLKDTVEIG